MLPECQTFFGGPVPTSLRSDGLEESNEWTRIGPGFNSSFIFIHKNRYFFAKKENFDLIRGLKAKQNQALEARG